MFAQAPGSCDLGSARQTLDINNVSACVSNMGALFGFVCPTDYEVPKGEGVDAILTGGLWVGGLAGGDLRFAGATYSNYQFWPGPLGSNGRPVNPNDCSDYNRIYKVSLSDITAYEGGATPAADLADWPADLGAPVVDGDGNPDNYDLAAGDRPNLRGGDQTLWWVMNDVGNIRSGTFDNNGAPPIGLEVQMQAWAYDEPTQSHLHNTTFYRAKILHKGSSALSDAVVSLWIDADVGNSSDDFFGSDPGRDLAYMYNGDNIDENGYGNRPAAIGATILRGLELANGTDTGAYAATSYTPFTGDSPQREATSAPQAFNFMNGLWRFGTPITTGGNGYDTSSSAGAVTRFLFSGTPPAAWSQVNNGDTPAERSMLLSTGPVTLANGDVQTVDFAIAFGRASAPGANAHVDAVTTLLSEVDAIRTFIATADEPGVTAPAVLELAVSPNPTRGTARLTLTLDRPQRATVDVFDPLGRRVAILHEGALSAGSHPFELATAALAPGMYVVRATTEAGVTSSRLTVTR